MNSVKVKQLKGNFVGKVLPTNHGGYSGRAFEKMLESEGIPVNQGNTADVHVNEDTKIEVKTRNLNASSPVTTGSMTVTTIINTNWEDSTVCEKLQQQMRVKTINGVIQPGANDIYDLSGWHIQDLFKEGYETIQTKLINGDRSSTIYGNPWIYAEKNRNSNNSYIFRHSDGAFKKIEAMSRSTFNDLFEVIK